MVGTADSVADSAVRGPFQDTVHIKLYNRGTTLLRQGKLQRALAVLDSAAQTSDTMLGFRASFNDGWGNLVRGRRIQAIITQGGLEADSILAAIERDTTLRRVTALDTLETLDGLENAIKAPLSDAEKKALALDYADEQLDSAVAKYRQALMLHPADRDAKWNYELALAVINVTPQKGNGQGQPTPPKDMKKAKRGTRMRHRRSPRLRQAVKVKGKLQKSNEKEDKDKADDNNKDAPKSRGKRGGSASNGPGGGNNKKQGQGGNSTANNQAQKTNKQGGKGGKIDSKGGEGGGGGNKEGKNGMGAGKGYDRNGPSGAPGNAVPDVEQMKLPPTQALQLLDAVGQHEQKPVRTIKVPDAAPPQGKDW